MSKQTLIYQAPVATRSGYGDHSRDLLYSLRSLNKFDIKIISTRWGMTPLDALSYDNEFHRWIIENTLQSEAGKPDVFVQVSVANEFTPKGYYNIGVTAGIETNAVPPNWVIGSNNMDLIITTSQHSKAGIANVIYNETNTDTNQIIRQHKLQKPIEVLFEGYDEKIFNKENIVDIKHITEIKEDFCFLFVGHWLRGDFGEDRKNIGMLIKTFAIAFKNENIKPALLLKTSSAGFSILDREYMISKIKSSLGPDYGTIPVYLLHGDLTPTEMNSLYYNEKIKSIVSFTKGEGFGRPLLEFSLTGKPVIASNWSGHLDFLNNGAILLEGDLKNVHPSAADDFLLKETSWFNVSVSKALVILKDLYKNYTKYLTASNKLGSENREKYTLSNMTKMLDGIFERYGIYEKSQPKFQQLQLPKLKMLNKDDKKL